MITNKEPYKFFERRLQIMNEHNNAEAIGMGSIGWENCEYMPEAVWCESSGDFSLPEYMPEIGKMLKVEPRIVPSGKYIGSDRAEFSGSVVYSVLYTGEDGVPFYTTLSGDYEYNVPLGEASDAQRIEIYDEPSLESVSVRPSGPRKISVRTRIKSQPHIMYERGNELPTPYDTDDGGYQTLCEECNVTHSGHFESGEFEISDVFSLDASPEAEPVGCEGGVCISELVFSHAGVICRGDVEYRVLYFDIRGGVRKLFCTKKKVRFEREIQCAQLADMTGARAYGRVISADMSSEEGSSDITVNLCVNIRGEYTVQKKSKFLCDIYSCTHELDIVRAPQQYRKNVLCKNFNFSYHAQKKFSEAGMGGCDIHALYGNAEIESVEISDGVAHVNGEISIDCIISDSERDGGEYSCFNIPMPFKCELPVVGTAQKYDISIMPDVSGVRARSDREGISADAELYLSVFISGCDTLTTVKNVEKTGAHPPRPSSVTVYFPDEGESLWSVGKKYSVSIDSLCKMNDISAASPACSDSLAGIGRILIV